MPLLGRAARTSRPSSPSTDLASLPSPTANATPGLQVLPGLTLAMLVLVLAESTAALVPAISPLAAATLAGAVVANGASARARRLLDPGLRFAAKSLLRLGVVLLGLRLSVAGIAGLGATMLAVVALTVVTTFVGVQWLGRRLGLSHSMSLLVATGYSICGASAIAAVEGVSEADEDEVAVSIGLVTVAGTVAMFGLPTLGTWLGLSDEQLGGWIGASVHDVAQVVAAGTAGGASVLAVAVVVKLARVLLLAPLVTGVGLVHGRATSADSSGATRLVRVPWFIAGFLVVVIVRSAGIVPATAADAGTELGSWLFGLALVGLGSGLRIERLRRIGPTALLLGALASLLVAGISLAATILLV